MIHFDEADENYLHYNVGMYGGKFMPWHMGHRFCARTASYLCDKLYLILFYGGAQEEEIIRNNTTLPKEFLTLDYRRNAMQKEAALITRNNKCHVIPLVIDVTNCKTPEGKEDWDAETPLVLTNCGKLDAVFSSEPSYDDYFKRAYPEATHILIDPPRHFVPISGTACRNMTEKEAKGWM